MAHAAYGRLPLKRCLESAIGFARDGFPVTARLAHWRSVDAGRAGARVRKRRRSSSSGRHRSLKNPDLARTLEAIASDGWYGFYDGEVARELVRYSDANDGFFTAGRPRGAVGALGRADQGQLSRRDDLRDAGADPGLRRAQDAEPAGAVRAAQASRSSGPTRASDGAGQAARLSRPRPPSRRPALRRRADGAADLQGLCRRAAGADGSRRAPCRGIAFPPTAACPATRSTSPSSTRPATRPR